MEYIAPINGDQGDPNRSYWNKDPLNPDANLRRGAQPPAESIEHPMREIVNVITASGLIPNQGDLTQLHAAIENMIANASSAVDFANNTQSIAGTANAIAITPFNFGSQQLKTANGYQILPGGIIFQWGAISLSDPAGNHTTSLTFPLTFPNSVFNGSLTRTSNGDTSSNGDNVRQSINAISNTGMAITYENINTQTGAGLYWFAIGH